MLYQNKLKSRIQERPFELRELGPRSRSSLIDTKKDPSPLLLLPSYSKHKKPQPPTNLELESFLKTLQSDLETQKKIVTDLSVKSKEQQEIYIKREQEYRNTLMHQESKLAGELSSKDPKILDSTRQEIDKIHKFHRKILEKITLVQDSTMKLLQGQEAEMVSEINEKLEEKLRELEDERQPGGRLYKKKEKEIELVKELEQYKAMVDGIDAKHKMYTEKNFVLKIRAKTHDQDIKILSKQMENLKAVNVKLKEKLRDCRSRRLTPQPCLRDQSPDFPSSQEKSLNPHHQEVITKLKKLIELESKNTRAARTAYSRELSNRTELSTLLSTCITDIKSKLLQCQSHQLLHSHCNPYQSPSVQILLSQERILTLLYDKAFPPKPLHSLSQKSLSTTPPLFHNTE